MGWRQSKAARAEELQKALHTIMSSPNVAQALCTIVHGKIDDAHVAMEEAQDNAAMWKEQGKVLALREILRVTEVHL
ncbi:MAG: hypothetical protein R3Y11_01820 [Pseudomonadota bacterium]